MMRDFKTAAKQFLETVATFTSYELMDYNTFVIYTIFTTMVALPRPELREKVRSVYFKFLRKNYFKLFFLLLRLQGVLRYLRFFIICRKLEISFFLYMNVDMPTFLKV